MTMERVIGIMSYYVYILASRKDGAIYIGVTNDLVRRIYEHRTKPFQVSHPNTISRSLSGSKSMTILFPRFPVRKNSKWKRSWKVQLIEAKNPKWDDLYDSICS